MTTCQHPTARLILVDGKPSGVAFCASCGVQLGDETMTPTYSPAPWSLDRGQLRDRDGNALASIPIYPDGIGGPVDLANGQIIAAAPDLVDALKAIYRLTGFVFSPDRRSVAVAELAGRALERAGVDPSSVIQEVQPHDDK